MFSMVRVIAFPVRRRGELILTFPKILKVDLQLTIEIKVNFIIQKSKKTRIFTDKVTVPRIIKKAESSDWNGGWRLQREKIESENPYCNTIVEQ
ncbi:hypothetical protein GCM10022410_01270 [Amphibacillus indicireducens]|uniref:Uncharacterized protein n=1 Tax=Amphibacillus indicireducens TaxID=1076330 RepID=A0ABP7V329_9BACI